MDRWLGLLGGRGGKDGIRIGRHWHQGGGSYLGSLPRCPWDLGNENVPSISFDSDVNVHVLVHVLL